MRSVLMLHRRGSHEGRYCPDCGPEPRSLRANRGGCAVTSIGDAAQIRQIGEQIAEATPRSGFSYPATWAVPATAFDARGFGDVEVQFVTTPGTPYQAQRSLDGTNFVNVKAEDLDGNQYDTVTAAGLSIWAASASAQASRAPITSRSTATVLMVRLPSPVSSWHQLDRGIAIRGT